MIIDQLKSINKNILQGCFLSGLGILALAGAQQKALASEFPSRDIEVIVPNGPGGANDLTVRSLESGLESALGVNVITVNQPASGGIVAAVRLAETDPSGHTLYFNSQSLITLSKTNDFLDLEKFQPVAQVVQDASAIAVNSNAPYNTLARFSHRV